MTTLNEIAYLVASRYGRPFDAQLVEEVAFAAKYWRAFLIRQDIEKNVKSPLYLQKITTKLEAVDELDNCYVKLGCPVLRTVVMVPMPVRTKTRSPFQYVGTGDMKHPFSYIPAERLFSITGNKIVPDIIYYTYYNGYIYVYNTLTLEYLAVMHAFEDPYAAGESCITGSSCPTYDEPFFAPGDMVKTIIDGLLSGTFSITPPVDQEVTVKE